MPNAYRQGDLYLIDVQFNASLRGFWDEDVECGPQGRRSACAAGHKN
jgi:hypothetical protein